MLLRIADCVKKLKKKTMIKMYSTPNQVLFALIHTPGSGFINLSFKFGHCESDEAEVSGANNNPHN